MLKHRSPITKAMEVRAERGRTKRRGLLAALAAMTMLGSVVFGAAPANAAIASSMCDFAVVIFVRGTDAPTGTGLMHGDRVWSSGGMGNVAGVRNVLALQPDIPYYFEALNYPATSIPNLETSINVGVSRLSAEVNYVNQTCPYAPIVLIGHSQGATVISHLLTGPTNPGLTTAAKNNIRAVALFGDPQYRTGLVTNFVNQPNNGLLSQSLTFPKSSLANYKYWGWPYGAATAQNWVYKVREYCLAGDFFCQSNPGDSNYAIHNNYGQFAAGVGGWILFMLTTSN